MEANGLGSGMFSSGINSGLLGVENPLQQNLPNQQNPHHLHQMVNPYAPHHDTDASHQQQQLQQQQPMKQHGYPPFASSAKNKQQQSSISDEDEPGFTAEESSGDPTKKKVSPWQRMKWTDTMVRLLIMAVYYIGDEAGSDQGTTTDPTKKKPTGLLQKKGKWKSVSRAMMEKGFYVSPQQCEDKFNDLNKRYKRVNDILGKGTACRVVENQNLLDTMDLSPKMKEEVKKLLNSKHLFFREMCAYHNSCGHGGGANSNSNVQQHQLEGGTNTTPPQAQPQQQQQQQQQQQHCFHSAENGMGNLGGSGGEGMNMRMLKMGNGEEEDDDEDEDDDESEDYTDEDENDEDGHEDEDENDHGRMGSLLRRKRSRKEAAAAASGFSTISLSSTSSSQLMQQLNTEVSGVFQDGGRSAWEKKQWMRNRIMQLEEQQISYQTQAFELEKQRLKWARFSSKKEREMERAKLENERRRLENERMVLLIRQKELELLKIQHHHQQQHQQQQHPQHSST